VVSCPATATTLYNQGRISRNSHDDPNPTPPPTSLSLLLTAIQSLKNRPPGSRHSDGLLLHSIQRTVCRSGARELEGAERQAVCEDVSEGSRSELVVLSGADLSDLQATVEFPGLLKVLAVG